MEREPSRMVAILRECGALARVLPKWTKASSRPEVPERLAARLDRAAARGYVLPVRYALLVLDTPSAAAEALAARVNAPTDCRRLALLSIAARELLAKAETLDAETTLGLLEQADAFRRPERLERLLDVAECDAGAEGDFAPRRALARAAEAARAVDAGAVARAHPDEVPDAIRRARLVAIAALQK
jgi:tRNA nucleotidyltransferase (CCA-adding enzyme)